MLLLLLSTQVGTPDLSVSQTQTNFQSPNALTTQSVLVTGGLPPYSASSGNVNIAAVTQGTSPNLYANADSLSSSTLAGLSLGTGGPRSAEDAEYTGTGVNATSSLSLTQTITVSTGSTYTPSWWVDMSQVTHGVLDMELLDINGTVISDTNGVTGPGLASQRVWGTNWTCPTNLAPHSDDLLSGWLTGSAIVIGTNGPGGAKSFNYTVPAGGQTYQPAYAVIAVSTGDVISWAAWCNPSCCSAGGLWFRIMDDATGGILYQTTITGTDGRHAASFTIPAGYANVRVVYGSDASVGTIPIGNTVIFSQPMITKLAADPGYYISSQTPKIQMRCLASNSQSGGFIVANGQKFKISQPMFALSTYDPGTYLSPTSLWNITPGTWGGTTPITFSDSAP